MWSSKRERERETQMAVKGEKNCFIRQQATRVYLDYSKVIDLIRIVLLLVKIILP
jgi:hypothetical protein